MRLLPATAAGQAAALAGTVTALALAAAGVATGVALQARAAADLDAALLAVATEAAHPELGEPWEAEGPDPKMTVRRWYGGPDPIVPARALERALRHERPAWLDVDDRRVLLLPAEIEIDGAEEEEEEHLVVVAQAPRVGFFDAAGPFLAAYAGVGVVIAGAAAALQALAMRLALRPLARAAQRAAGVGAACGGLRLPEDGPQEVRALLAALNGLLARLEASFAAQARFTAEAAHELRTPVAALRGELEVALRRPRTAEAYRAALEAGLEEAGRLGLLVDGLLALARLDAGGGDTFREAEHAGALALRAAAQEKAGLDVAGCTLRVDTGPDPEVPVQTPLMVAAVANLLRNAARHAPGSHVSLRVERRGSHVAFVVEDDGPGVPPAEREAVFGRFVRGAAARRADREGLGLGLSFTREVARRHGGDCVLEDRSSGGCRAVLTLLASTTTEVPAGEADAVDDRGDEDRDAEAPARAPPSSG